MAKLPERFDFSAENWLKLCDRLRACEQDVEREPTATKAKSARRLLKEVAAAITRFEQEDIVSGKLARGGEKIRASDVRHAALVDAATRIIERGLNQDQALDEIRSALHRELRLNVAVDVLGEALRKRRTPAHIAEWVVASVVGCGATRLGRALEEVKRVLDRWKSCASPARQGLAARDVMSAFERQEAGRILHLYENAAHELETGPDHLQAIEDLIRRGYSEEKLLEALRIWTERMREPDRYKLARVAGVRLRENKKLRERVRYAGTEKARFVLEGGPRRE